MTASKAYATAMPSNMQLYDLDFYAWANEQAALLRSGRYSEADMENIAEEIESMGKSQKRALISRLTVLLVHLLKWKYQSAYRSRSWEVTIREQRRRLQRHLNENPSLKPFLPEALAIAYSDAVPEAGLQTGFAETTFPSDCRWTLDQIISADWLPE